MNLYTKERRVFIVKQYFITNKSLAAIVRYIRLGSTSDLKLPDGPLTQNIKVVRESVVENLEIQIPRFVPELNISICLTIYLHLRSYTVPLSQQ